MSVTARIPFHEISLILIKPRNFFNGFSLRSLSDYLRKKVNLIQEDLSSRKNILGRKKLTSLKKTELLKALYISESVNVCKCTCNDSHL